MGETHARPVTPTRNSVGFTHPTHGAGERSTLRWHKRVSQLVHAYRNSFNTRRCSGQPVWRRLKNRCGAELGPLPAGARRMVLVATQGKGDLDGLKAALTSGADYIGFVSSRQKFASLAQALRGAGVDGADLARIHAPAGLAIEAVTPDEVALSILAQVIKTRRSGQRRPVAEPPSCRPHPARSGGKSP
ncbi:MAG: XdhC family protein [Roseovarius sp.]|nr:XdhC family protein [Roseovarius sp.]